MTIEVPFLQGGAVGVLLLVVWLILTGRLVPRTVVRDLRDDRDERVAQAQLAEQEWREAYQLSIQNDRVRDEQIRKLLDVLETTDRLLTTLRLKLDEGDADASTVA